MALDPNTQDPSLDPYVAWASQQQQPLQVQTAEYTPAAGMMLPPPPQPPPPPPPPPPAPPPKKFDRTTGPTTDELRAGKVDADGDTDNDTTAKSDTDVDAISGAAPAATVADIGKVSYEQPTSAPNYLAPDYYEHTAQQIAGEPLQSLQEKKANELGQDEAAAIAKMSPDQYVQFKANREGAVLAKQAELQHQANIDAMDRARQERDDYMAAIQKADADSKEVAQRAQLLANTKINPNRYEQNRGVFGTLRDFTSVLLTGLGGNAQLGLQQFNRRVDADIDAQKSDLANAWQGVNARRTAIGDELARHGDMYKAAETYRLAAYQAQINDVQTQLQQFDPQGATAIRGRDALDQLHAAQQAALIAFNQQQLKNQLDIAKENREAAVANSTIQHQRTEENIAYGHLGLERDKAKQLTPAEQERLDKLAGRAIGGVPIGVDKDGNVQRGPLTQPDGTVFIPKDEDEAKRLKKMAPSVNEVNRLANQMVRDIADLSTIDKSSTLATAKHQQLMADKEALIFALHGSKGIEGFRPGTAEMLDELLGGVSPDKIGRDASAGIIRARDNINADFTGQLHVAGWQGQKYEPADTSKPAAPVSTADEKELTTLISGGGRHSENYVEGSSGGVTDIVGPTAERTLDGWWSDYTGKTVGVTPERQKLAGEFLLRVATQSKHSEIKKRAQELLQGAAQESLETAPTSPEMVGGPQGTTQKQIDQYGVDVLKQEPKNK